MREREDRPGPLALSWLAAAEVARLKADAAELSELYASLDEQERAKLLILLFGSALPGINLS